MVDLICQHCGSFLASLPARRGETVSVPCPSCGRTLEFEVLDPHATWDLSPDGEQEAGEEARQEDGMQGWSTLFHPGSLSIPREDSQSDTPPAGDATAEAARTVYVGQGTVLLKPKDLQPAPPRLGIDACFLVPRNEGAPLRIAVTALRTTFGRAGADVNLDDAAVSGRHFQVEVVGSEFFIRDLESRNGTLLNGRRIRYCELRPGDEVLAGRTVLLFRISDSQAGDPPERESEE